MPKLYDFYKTNGGDHRTVIEGPSMTRQEFKDECDINTLMSKYEQHAQFGPSGLMMHHDPSMFYADFTVLPETLMEYHEFMDSAQASFMRLPAQVRKEFDNDPVQFVEFASDPGSLEQMRTWGLAPPAKPVEAPAAPAPGPVPPAAPAAPASSAMPSEPKK